MRLKIIAEPSELGLALQSNVRVIDVDTGERIEDPIRSITWRAVADRVVTAEIELCLASVEVVGDGTLIGVDKNGKRYKLTEIEQAK